MLSVNFKPKRTVAVSRGFLATARLSCLFYFCAAGIRTRVLHAAHSAHVLDVQKSLALR